MLSAYSRLKEILQATPAKLFVISDEVASNKPNPKNGAEKKYSDI